MAVRRCSVDKYTWVDVGSSYVISEMNAAYLYCQLKALDRIQSRRSKLLERYRSAFTKQLDTRFARWMTFSTDCKGNAHVAALVFTDSEILRKCQAFCRASGIEAVIHYVPLHSSPFAKQHPEIIKTEGDYPNTEMLGQQLLRLPIFYNMEEVEADFVISTIMRFSRMLRSEQISETSLPSHLLGFAE